jgi:putative transcriptional regulator
LGKIIASIKREADMSRKKTKSRHMTDETFAELTKSAKQALAYERGEDSGHRVTRIAVPRPPRPMSSAEIARIRQQLNYSQSVFARVLNVSPKTVQAWEQGIRVPSDAALKLLTIAKRHPEVLLEA